MSLGMGSQLDSNGVPLADRSLGCLPIRRRLNRNRTPAQAFLPSFRAIAACASGLPLSWLPAHATAAAFEGATGPAWRLVSQDGDNDLLGHHDRQRLAIPPCRKSCPPTSLGT